MYGFLRTFANIREAITDTVLHAVLINSLTIVPGPSSFHLVFKVGGGGVEQAQPPAGATEHWETGLQA